MSDTNGVEKMMRALDDLHEEFEKASANWDLKGTYEKTIAEGRRELIDTYSLAVQRVITATPLMIHQKVGDAEITRPFIPGID